MEEEKKAKYEFLVDKIEYCKDHFITETSTGFINRKQYLLLKNYRGALINNNRGEREFSIYETLQTLYTERYLSFEQYSDLISKLDKYKLDLFNLLASSQKIRVFSGKSLYKLKVEEELYKHYQTNKKKKAPKEAKKTECVDWQLDEERKVCLS